LSRSKIKLVASALAATATLAGCSDIYLDRREYISLSAGDALRSNQVVHMVDPWPAHSARRDIAFDGQKMQSAVERYRTNRVIPPVNATTSTAGYSAVATPLAPKP
jgi:hypothetical protein